MEISPKRGLRRFRQRPFFVRNGHCGSCLGNVVLNVELFVGHGGLRQLGCDRRCGARRLAMTTDIRFVPIRWRKKQHTRQAYVAIHFPPPTISKTVIDTSTDNGPPSGRVLHFRRIFPSIQEHFRSLRTFNSWVQAHFICVFCQRCPGSGQFRHSIFPYLGLA